MKHPEPYRDRRTRLADVREHQGHHVKLYAISASGAGLPEALLEVAWSHAREHFPEREEGQPSHGFLVLHQGTEAVWLLLYHWTDDILYQQLFRAPLEASTDLSPAGFSAACVWELEVVTHERNAWVHHVLSKPSAPDYEAYLEDELRIDPGE